MGKHHNPENPVIVRRGFGSGTEGNWFGFRVERASASGDFDPFDSEIIIHYYDWKDGHGKEPMHRLKGNK